MNLLTRWRRWLPKREAILANRWLGWLKPWLGRVVLWQWSRRGVALGVALGVFFGLLIPLAQIPFAVATAVVLRANVPAAAASTLVSNPLTFGPIYYAGYRLGNWLLGEDKPVPEEAANSGAPTLEKRARQRLVDLGKPLLLGLSVMAVLGATLTYLLIDLVWRWHDRRKGGAKPQLPENPAS